MFRAADGDVQLVGRRYAEFPIAKLPPELMTDDSYVHRRARLDSILDCKNNTRCCEKQDNDYQDGDHCPRELDLVTAIDLRRFGVVFASGSEAKNHKDEQ